MNDMNLVSEFDDYNDADELLFLNKATSGICANNSHVLYVSPSNLNCYKVDAKSSSLIFKIDSDRYFVNRNVDADKLIQPPYRAASKYMEENSTVTGVGANDDKIYIAVENKDDDAKSRLIKKNIGIFIVDQRSHKGVYTEVEYPDNAIVTNYCFYKNQFYYLTSSLNGKTDLQRLNIDSLIAYK